jgi:hypothetical protein
VALAHQLAADADVVGVELADGAAVAVDRHRVDAHGLSERAGGQRLARAAAPGLAALGRVDSVQAEAQALRAAAPGPGIAHHLDGVAVEDAHHAGIEVDLGAAVLRARGEDRGHQHGGGQGGGARGEREAHGRERRRSRAPAHAPAAPPALA